MGDDRFLGKEIFLDIKGIIGGDERFCRVRRVSDDPGKKTVRRHFCAGRPAAGIRKRPDVFHIPEFPLCDGADVSFIETDPCIALTAAGQKERDQILRIFGKGRFKRYEKFQEAAVNIRQGR